MESQNHPRSKYADHKPGQKISQVNKRNQAGMNNSGKKPVSQKKSPGKLHKLENLPYQELDAD